jgi:catechol 2,3-dioxygenase-like lactoylglutathione lyase family enzyme
MKLELDHILVPARNRVASAKRLAEILGVPWAEVGVGPFSPVYLNDGLTLDFDESNADFKPGHYCFRVSEAEFDEVLDRIRASNIPFRSRPSGTADYAINTHYGGKIVYWNDPDEHVWELLTVSYARRP